MTTASPEPQYSAGTVEDGARHHRSPCFTAEGLKSGHGTGTIAWLPAPDYEMPSVPWQPPQQPPVIALLDSGVQPHDWLPQGGDVAVRHRCRLAVPVARPGAAAAGPATRGLDSRSTAAIIGHGTFIAGLIRRQAPDAQILSMPVMNYAGQVCPRHVVDALTWLAEHPETHVRIVLMCFGRQPIPGMPTWTISGRP